MDSVNVDTLLAQFHSLVDVNKTSLLLSLLAISFNPIAWNIVARNGTWHLFFFFSGLANTQMLLIYIYEQNTETKVSRVFLEATRDSDATFSLS